jgi:hypothetical protein
MKAEQRKQLETNVLADRMGRVVKDLRKGPSRRGLLIWIPVIALFLAAIVYFWIIRPNQLRSTSQLWRTIAVGSHVQSPGGGQTLRQELLDNKDSTPARVARYQEAWKLLWDDGIRKLYSSSWRGPSPEAVANIFRAELQYEDLYKESKDDPILGPQALYNMAVAQEALAVYEPKFLDTAKSTFETVLNTHNDSVYARKAKERLDVYKDKDKLAELRSFYGNINREFDAQLQGPMAQLRQEFERTFAGILDRVRKSS